MSDIKGNVVNVQVSGPASAVKAKKLAKPRKITLGGDLAGSVEFDGSQDVELEAKVLNAQETAKPDYSQNDEAQPDYIKNRPGGYYQIVPGVDITWDGVIGDRPKVELDEGMYLVKVSDEVLTAEQMIGATLTVTQGEQQQSSVLNDENVQASDGYVSCDGLISFSKTTVSVGRQTLTVPETGTYFIYGEQSGGVAYVSALQKSDSQVLVPIPGELTNIKGGYDLLAINNQPVYSGTVPASAFSIATQAAEGGEIAVQAAVARVYSAPITLTNPLAEGATVSGTVNGTAVSGVVTNNDGDLEVALYPGGVPKKVAARAVSAKGLVCVLIGDAVIVQDNPPETDMVLALSQSREAMPKVIPAEYLDVDLGAVESRIDEAETAANAAQTAATSEIRTNNLCFRTPGNTGHNATDVPSIGVMIGNMYKSSTGVQYYPVSLTAKQGLQLSADASNPSYAHARLYTENVGGRTLGVLQLQDDNGKYVVIRPGSILGSSLEFGKGIIIQSSTTGSAKKFKITVDDTGTLKVTEVTDS